MLDSIEEKTTAQAHQFLLDNDFGIGRASVIQVMKKWTELGVFNVRWDKGRGGQRGYYSKRISKRDFFNKLYQNLQEVN